MDGNAANFALRGPSLGTFFRLAEEWQLSEAEQMILLGSPAAADFQDWRRGDIATANGDVLERISLLLGIDRAIRTLLSDDERANLWIRAPNSAPLFGGRSALDHMLDGGVAGLWRVRAYLDRQLQ